jgi:hypothetical protein
VDFVALPLPCVERLPEGAESTNDVPYEKFELHRKAFDGLAAPFSEFLGAACSDGGKKPDWIIVDLYHHWAAAAANEHKVRTTRAKAELLLFNNSIHHATVTSVYHYLTYIDSLRNASPGSRNCDRRHGPLVVRALRG